MKKGTTPFTRVLRGAASHSGAAALCGHARCLLIEWIARLQDTARNAHWRDPSEGDALTCSPARQRRTTAQGGGPPTGGVLPLPANRLISLGALILMRISLIRDRRRSSPQAKALNSGYYAEAARTYRAKKTELTR